MAVDPKHVAGALGGIAAAVALAIPFIMQREGHANIPYKDIGGVLTVCYGHTGPDVQVKDYTTGDCRQLLNNDVNKTVNQILDVTPQLATKPKVLASTISFVYNIGIDNYKRSSVAADFKVGNYNAGCKMMLRYVYAGGKYSQGLANRRKLEYNLCMEGLQNAK